MLPDHLVGPDLSSFFKRKLFLIPGSGYHAWLPVLLIPQCSRHQITDTVHQPHTEPQRALHIQVDGFRRDELRLRRRDGFAIPALRHLIKDPFPLVPVFYVGDDHQIHKSLDKRRFTYSHRPHDADINVSACPTANILINIHILQNKNLPAPCTVIPTVYEGGSDSILIFQRFFH